MDMVPSLVGCAFESREGAVTCVEYANFEGQGPRESFGVTCITPDNIRSGTTVGGAVLRQQIEAGELIAIGGDAYAQRRERSIPWLEAVGGKPLA